MRYFIAFLFLVVSCNSDRRACERVCGLVDQCDTATDCSDSAMDECEEQMDELSDKCRDSLYDLADCGADSNECPLDEGAPCAGEAVDFVNSCDGEV